MSASSVEPKGGRAPDPVASTSTDAKLIDLHNLELPAAELRRELDETRTQRDTFARELSETRSSLLSLERESTQLVTKLRDEVNAANQAKDQLMHELRRLRAGVDGDHAQEKADLLNNLDTLQHTFRERETQLLAKNEQLQADLASLRGFKEERQRLQTALADAKKELVAAKSSYKKDVTELERAFLAVQARLEESSRLQLLNSRSTLRKEAHKQLDEESIKMRKENVRLMQELRFHEETSDALQAQNTALREQLKQLRLEQELNSSRDTAYATRGLRQRKVIQELNSKVKELERSLGQALRDLEVERATASQQQRDAVEDLELQVDSLKRSLQLKSKELKRIKSLAQTIVDQRSETETFFLEALEHVKQEIRAQKRERFKQAQAEYRQHLKALALNSGRRLPGLGATTPEPVATDIHERVELAHLTLEDRDRVLRVLFSKINGSQVASETMLPKHSFALPSVDRRSRSAGGKDGRDPQTNTRTGDASSDRLPLEAPPQSQQGSFFVTDMGTE